MDLEQFDRWAMKLLKVRNYTGSRGKVRSASALTRGDREAAVGAEKGRSFTIRRLGKITTC